MSESNIVVEYLNITEYYRKIYGNNTVLLMAVGAFYEIYALKNNDGVIRGSPISEIASICNLNLSDTKKQKVGDEHLLMAGFRDYSLDKYLPKIVDADYTVVVYKQVKSGNKVERRVLDSIYSAGTYLPMEEKLNQITNNIMCIWMETIKSREQEKIIYGLSIVNIFTGKSSMFEYESAYNQNIMNPTTFDELERAVSVFDPSEVIFISPFDEKTVASISQFSGLKCNIHSINISDSNQKVNNCMKQIFVQHMLDTFYGDESYTKCNEFSNYVFATQSLCFLLDFIQEHNASLVKHISFPIFNNVSHRTVLANHTLQQLNIIDNNQGQGALSSVLNFMNKCCTSTGKRLFKYQITNPTFDEIWLEKEYSMISEAMDKYEIVENSRRLLHSVVDIEKILRQLILRAVYPNSLYGLYSSIKVVIEIINNITSNKILEYASNDNDILSSSRNFLEFLDDIFYVDVCQKIFSNQSFENNIIKPGVSEELDHLIENQKINDKMFEELYTKLNDIMKAEHGNNREQEFIKIHETEKSGTTLQMTKRRANLFKDIIKKSSSKIVNIYADSNNEQIFLFSDIKFVSASGNADEIILPLLSTILKKKTVFHESINRKIASIFQDILSRIEDSWLHELENISSFISKIDVLSCKTFISKKNKYCQPQIEDSEQSFVRTEGLRHCLIEHIQTSEKYVTNDLHLGSHEQDGILLYGTNAVGKTSLIRALGISVILAQCGMFVPCSLFTYKPYTAIFSRILGNDNLFKGLSTFAVEISELRVILKMADERSLILGDEVCSGTETESALSIFVSALMKIHSKKSSFIFATHFHEIINYEEIKSLTNMVLYHMHVMFDREEGCLIYDRKLKKGSGTRMYGLEVCKSLYLDNEFLEQAYTIRNKYFPDQQGDLSHKTSHYNSKKIRGKCEMCNKELSSEIHHLEYQEDADENGFIGSIHKNHPANLLAICEPCHLKIHADNKKMRKKKTTKGIKIISEP